jgi:DNA repair protein RadD
MNLELRPEQQAIVDAVSAAFRSGHKRVMVSACCGFGKTEIATAMLAATQANGKRGAFLADRRALVQQTSERFDKYGLDHGILMADHWRYRPSTPIQVCSVQTLQRRGWPAGINVLFVDEAHVLSEAVRGKLEKKDCYAVGLSATAITRGLGQYFDAVVNAPTTNEMIRMGRLVPLEIHSFDQPDMAGVSINRHGEYAGPEAEKRVLQNVGDVVQKYLADGAGRKFICFAWSIAHAEDLQRQFLAAGINVATYTADDRPEDRHESVQLFKGAGSPIRGLISVAALTRGFDQTDVDLLIDARPLRRAVHEYVQMLGRVMRAHPGKTHATVFDHSGNAIAFWHQWNDLFENGVTELDDGKPKQKKSAAQKLAEPVKCPKCSAVHRPSPCCPVCGHEYPKKRVIENVPGSLKEILASGDSDTMRKSIWPGVCWYVRHTRNPRDDDHAQRMAQAIYIELTGQPARARYSTTAAESCADELLARIRANQQRWAIARRASRSQGSARAGA